MAEEKLSGFFPHQGHSIEPGAFTLDLYRLVCMVLADRQVANRTLTSDAIRSLQETHLRPEIGRILISCAAGLRILFDARPAIKGWIDRSDCGKLYPDWPSDESKVEKLTLREACNKIIHAQQIRFDEVVPNAAANPDNEGVFLRPYLYLYGSRNRHEWRAVLSIIDFAKWGAASFLGM
ncbi:hypothetical protein [Bradyrhizobium sp. AUGA SZCCT0283]|uniref:hypothetical protein n=1 Tax=Bradyrhizobium sp. AUGA SZCCT0283 TaxID=2807671 RepID=UPI001BA4B420|nr:hypothetical protein [Bradyrhizobium sp. AUGA SZCCT0283]MBR1278666.1 hypothetical protein [Bradyrhizobium sp. AUGA SZCCT0283]